MVGFDAQTRDITIDPCSLSKSSESSFFQNEPIFIKLDELDHWTESIMHELVSI